MKKILIIASNMEIGGAERALLGLLEKIDTIDYSVDLFLMRHYGPLMKLIPENINLLPENSKYADIAVPIMNVIKKGHIGVVVGRAVGKFEAKRYRKKHNILKSNSVDILYSYLYTKRFLPNISDEEYDLAIGFTIPYYLTDEKVKAKTKAVWIHTDFSYEEADVETELKAWSAYPHIVSVSESVSEAFLEKYPSLRDRVVVIENILSKEFLLDQAKEPVTENMLSNDGSVKLLSIGRFSPPKNFDNIPDICRSIIQKGIDVKWFIIGYGGEEGLIRRKIKEAGMENNVIILGKKENPYPYIKACDIYVQPSRYEGKCVAVREAQILNKPVIITNYATSASQLTDGYDGVIVPMDNEGCADGIAAVINDKNLQRRLIENTKKNDYTNAGEVEKIYEFISGNCSEQ